MKNLTLHGLSKILTQKPQEDCVAISFSAQMVAPPSMYSWVRRADYLRSHSGFCGKTRSPLFNTIDT
jgi:hypothetical protein